MPDALCVQNVTSTDTFGRRAEKSSSKTLWRSLKSALGQVRLRMQDWIGTSARRLRAMGLFMSRSFVLQRGRCR